MWPTLQETTPKRVVYEMLSHCQSDWLFLKCFWFLVWPSLNSIRLFPPQMLPHSAIFPDIHIQSSWHTLTEAFMTERAQECAYTCVKCLRGVKDRVSRKGIVHLSADLWGKEHTTTTCVQMAMHGPCHVFSPYCSSEELWLLLLVRKYRKIEFHKNMHSPWK